MEREAAAQPKEARKTAERVLLAERLRETGVEQGVAARRAKFGDKAAAPAAAAPEKVEQQKATTQSAPAKNAPDGEANGKANCEFFLALGRIFLRVDQLYPPPFFFPPKMCQAGARS